MRVKIYQINPERDNNRMKFMSLSDSQSPDPSIALAKKLGASYIGCKSTFDMLKKSEVSNETKTEAEQFDKMLYRIYR